MHPSNALASAQDHMVLSEEERLSGVTSQNSSTFPVIHVMIDSYFDVQILINNWANIVACYSNEDHRDKYPSMTAMTMNVNEYKETQYVVQGLHEYPPYFMKLEMSRHQTFPQKKLELHQAKANHLSY